MRGEQINIVRVGHGVVSEVGVDIVCVIAPVVPVESLDKAISVAEGYGVESLAASKQRPC